MDCETFGMFTSLPGNGAWVYVQTGKPSDLFLSQRGRVSLFYTQFLYKDTTLIIQKSVFKSVTGLLLYLQSVDLNRGELSFSSTERDQAVIQSLNKQKNFWLPVNTSNNQTNKAPTLSDCVDSWNMRASMAAATKLLAAVMA